MLINEIIQETTSGGIAIVAQPMGKMQKRPNPSIFPTGKKKKVKEEAQFNPEVHAKFANVLDANRPKAIYDWAKANGISSHDAMIMAGYEKRFGQNMYDYLPPKQ
tara:strand:- start:1294 stop:1608 length:315 start_codon:yes stop_codon:yes gene_type:complete